MDSATEFKKWVELEAQKSGLVFKQDKKMLMRHFAILSQLINARQLHLNINQEVGEALDAADKIGAIYDKLCQTIENETAKQNQVTKH